MSGGRVGFLAFVDYVGVVLVGRGMWRFECCPINATAALTACMISAKDYQINS